MMKLLLIPILMIFTGCGTAKTTFVDAKYEACTKTCTLKYSKYESKKMSACKSECYKKKRDVNQPSSY